MKKGMIFLIAILVLLSATAITFARNTAAITISAITAGGNGGYASVLDGIADIPADVALKHSSDVGAANAVNPTWTPVVEQPGAITAGDLYYLDTSSYTGDIYVTLYLTNADELRKDYSYLHFNVNVYTHSDKPVLPGDWSAATTVDGTEIPVYLTLVNGSVSFYLEGAAYYTIAVDGGDYYCIDTNAVGGDLTPSFYMEVSPL